MGYLIISYQCLVLKRPFKSTPLINNCLMIDASINVGRHKKQIKRQIMNEINALKPGPDATIDEAIEALVKQAEFYTNFLISRHDPKKSTTTHQEKRRGHFEEELEEERELLELEEEESQVQFTRLVDQPSSLKGGKLKHYQLVGLNWMISLYESGLSGILADDMGLGKTIQTISLVAFLKEYKRVDGPHIVIVPKSTMGNWKNEFEKWLPDCNVVKLIPTKDERNDILTNFVIPGKFDVLITSFEGVRICLSYLTKIKWHYIIIDEAHKIKNEESQLSQLIRRLNNECKLLLTGTPLQNNLHELWSLLNFLLPEIFDSSELFQNWLKNKGEGEDDGVTDEELEQKNMHMIQQLHKILRPFMLRRTKIEVEKTLPPKKEVHIFVGLTDAQHKVYKNLLQNRNACEEEKKVYLNLLMQLRKVCNHPYLFEGVEPADAPSLGEHIVEASGKLIVLDKLLKKLFTEGRHQVLIFSQMTMVLDILEDYLNYREYKYCRIDGSTDMTSRDEQIENFMHPDSDKFVFLLSTRAGGLGINLTSADTVIIYDSDWNPQMDMQAMDRAHRIGQKNPVNVYRLITENTIEEKIIERQKVKLKWDNVVIQQAKTASQKNKTLSKEEVKQMLQYGASITLKSDKGTITDEDIDKVLERGEIKTNELNKALEEKIKKQQDNLTDFSMNSINIFDFMMDDEQQRKDDQQALDEAFARKLNDNDVEMRTRREKSKNVNYQIDSNAKKELIKAERKINLPQYHFYPNRDVLLELMEKEDDYNLYRGSDPSLEPLTEEEQLLKNTLLESGFRNWLKSDFNNFISASEKYGKDNVTEIAKFVGKPLKEVTAYYSAFWEGINELSDKERIIKQIQTGQDKIANKKYNMELLEWKASKCYEIDFNPQIYTKFKSKLFSIDADRFLAQMAFKFGLKNMSQIKQKIRSEPMFRFDYHFRSRTESELNKRLQSLYKLIEKEKDQAEFGFDNEMFKESKKKAKKKKEEDKKNENQEEVCEEEHVSDEEDDEANKNPRKRKQKQTLLTNYRKKPEPIDLEEEP